MSNTTITLPRPRRRGRWLTVLLALLVFFGGIVVGGAGTVLVIVHQVRFAIDHPEQIPARLTVRLTHKLDLDADQSGQVEQILTARLGTIEHLRAQIRPDVRTQLTGINTDIRNLLNPRQQEKWDKMYDDLIDNWLPASMRSEPGARIEKRRALGVGR